MRKCKKKICICMIFVVALLLSVCSVVHVSASTVAEPEFLPFDKTVSGVLSKDTSEYYYITTDSKNVNYEFVLKNNASSESSNFSILHISIVVTKFRSDGSYDVSDFLIDTWVDPTVSRTFKQTIELEKNTKYIIRVKPFYYEDTPYTLSVYQTSKTPTIKKTSSQKKSITVKYGKVSSTSSYQVAVKKKGGSWKTYTTKNTSYTIKKLSSKQTYYIKVRSVKKINGKNHYSAWSSISKVKTK